jgi:hypothetical protein
LWLGVLLGVRLSEGEAAIVPPRTLGVIYGEPHFEGGVCDFLCETSETWRVCGGNV